MLAEKKVRNREMSGCISKDNPEETEMLRKSRYRCMIVRIVLALWEYNKLRLIENRVGLEISILSNVYDLNGQGSTLKFWI